MREDLESIALELLTDVEITPPISAFTLAHWCGLSVEAMSRQGRTRGFALYFDGSLSECEREWQVAIAIAYWRLARIGARTDDADVEYLARALMMPRFDFVRDARSMRMFVLVQQRHRYVGIEKIRQRWADLYDEIMRLRVVGS